MMYRIHTVFHYEWYWLYLPHPIYIALRERILITQNPEFYRKEQIPTSHNTFSSKIAVENPDFTLPMSTRQGTERHQGEREGHQHTHHPYPSCECIGEDVEGKCQV